MFKLKKKQLRRSWTIQRTFAEYCNLILNGVESALAGYHPVRRSLVEPEFPLEAVGSSDSRSTPSRSLNASSPVHPSAKRSESRMRKRAISCPRYPLRKCFSVVFLPFYIVSVQWWRFVDVDDLEGAQFFGRIEAGPTENVRGGMAAPESPVWNLVDGS